MTLIRVGTLALSLVLAVLQFSLGVQEVNRKHRTFEVDYVNDQFLKDGEPFRYISGSLHYFRVPRAYWRDRLRKYRAAGLNAISTYIEWKLHEPKLGVYSFEGENDIEHFLRLAKEEELLVVLRPGPYICAERDFGGHPPWLLHDNPNMLLRTNDSSYTKYVDRWLSVLLPRIQPLLYGNGGPIIMVQVENEYGSYGACDHAYTTWLRDVFRSYVADDAVLFTTDGSGAGFLKCGPIPGVFTTVDFGCGGNASDEFKALRAIQPRGPLVNSELYSGWLTTWGGAPGTASTHCVVNTTRQLLQLNASFNYYMFHGGTNFHLSSGADPPFQPQVTSYDYDAPISESGNLTDKYYAIKHVLAEVVEMSRGESGVSVDMSEPAEYGTVVLNSSTPLIGSGSGVEYGTFHKPRTLESLQQYSGLMLYQTTLPPDYRGQGYLAVSSVHDRAIVFINNKAAGVLSRMKPPLYSMIIGGQAGQPLALLVENQGHICYGDMSDLKGLIGNITLNGEPLTGWKQTGYPLNDTLPHHSTAAREGEVKLPAYFSGIFQIRAKQPYHDTFVDMTGWGKGVLWVNEWCLGRYWPAEGPQVSLYLPGPRLRALNTITVLELEAAGPDYSVRLRARPRPPAPRRGPARSPTQSLFVRGVDTDFTISHV